MNALTFQALRCLADGRFHSGEQVARRLGRSRATLSDALKGASQLGVELFSVPGRGYRLAGPIEFLDAAEVLAMMGPIAPRIRLEVADQVDSTNTRLLARAAEGAATGECLAAEWQSGGRGRRGRAWVGGLGASLMFSMLWRFERGVGALAGLSLAAGVAVARALRECGVAQARVKWPNDLLVDGSKLAGILIETSGDMEGPSVAVIGVGVNHRLGELAAAIDQPVADVASHAASVPSRNLILARALVHLVATLDAFERAGFAPLRDEWKSLHAYQGARVRVTPPREAEYEADVVDVAEDGALVVQAAGRTHKLASAEITGVRVRGA